MPTCTSCPPDDNASMEFKEHIKAAQLRSVYNKIFKGEMKTELPSDVASREPSIDLTNRCGFNTSQPSGVFASPGYMNLSWPGRGSAKCSYQINIDNKQRQDILLVLIFETIQLEALGKFLSDTLTVHLNDEIVEVFKGRASYSGIIKLLLLPPGNSVVQVLLKIISGKNVKGFFASWKLYTVGRDRTPLLLNGGHDSHQEMFDLNDLMSHYGKDDVIESAVSVKLGLLSDDGQANLSFALNEMKKFLNKNFKKQAAKNISTQVLIKTQTTMRKFIHWTANLEYKRLNEYLEKTKISDIMKAVKRTFFVQKDFFGQQTFMLLKDFAKLLETLYQPDLVKLLTIVNKYKAVATADSEKCETSSCGHAHYYKNVLYNPVP